ncbi:putrescine aminotransferase [bacterium SCN 62-11]|nr:aspartate aminotransferase family protein [Candidatus Eremiobacteraeota bacterium]ODT80855.1 MAG: putrescine aminotransferase [bacterium SCN 62-11]
MESSNQELHEVSRLYRQHISPDLARLMKFGGPGSLEVSARDCRVTDHLGRVYLDFAGGYGVFSLGHAHPEVVAAVSEQLQKLPLSSRVLLNPQQAYLARDLAQVAPGQLQFSFFCNSGAEAVEGALKLARLATGRSRLLACHNSYHGKTLGALSVTGREKYRQPFEPLIPEVGFVEFGDLEQLRAALDDQIAAFIVEPVLGEGGIHVAPPGYLAEAQRLCREKGALLIADEVQCGLGRTGKLFAVEHWGVEPDLLVLAKALGGGVVPAGAILGTPTVWQALKGRPLIHTSTFGGNPLACVAGRKTLEILQRDGLVARAAESGEWLLTELEKLRQEFPQLIAQVRGLGLMIGLECTGEQYAGALISELLKHQLLAVYTLNQPKVIRLEPPLTISRTDLQVAVDAFKAALSCMQPVAVS